MNDNDLARSIPPLGSLAIHECMCWRCGGTGNCYVNLPVVEGEIGQPVRQIQCPICQGSGQVFIIAKPKPLDVQGLVDQLNRLMPNAIQ